MELKALHYFLACAKTENFRKAAQQLNITQPALSRRIADLEAQLGTSLFERQRRRVRLTAAGAMLVKNAEDISSKVDEMLEQAKLITHGHAGRLRIGLNRQTPRIKTISKAILRYRQERPQVELQFTSMLPEAQYQALKAGELDIAFVFEPPSSDKSTIEQLTINHETLVLAMARSHRLAKRRQIVLADLVNEDFIWMPRSSSPTGYDRLIAACVAGGLSPRIVQEVLDEDASIGLISIGIAVGLLNSSIVQRRHSSDITFKAVEDLALEIRHSMVWLKSNQFPALTHFVRVVTESVANGPKMNR